MGYLSILSDRRRERLYKDYDDDDGRSEAGVSKPAAPLNLAASVVDEVSIGLTWDAVTEADSYKIYYGTDGVTFASSTTSATNSKTVEGLTADTTYYFYTVAIKGTTEGNASATANAKTYNYFITSVVTTGAETLTLERIDVKAGESITIDWDDGLSDTYNNEGVARTHAYAGTGTWAVKISGARFITYVDLRDAKLRFNSESFLSCGDNLASIRLTSTLASPVIDSADMAHLKLSNQLYLSFAQAGTYSIDSAHFASYTLSNLLYLSFTQAGTYSIDSAHFASYTLSYQLYLSFAQAGTYSIDSSHFAAYTLSYQLYLRFDQAGTYSIDSAHFASYTLSNQLYLRFTQAGTYSIDSAHFASYTLSYLLYLYFTQAGTYSIDSAHFASYTLSNLLYLYFAQAGTYSIDSAHFASYTLSNLLYLYFAQAGTYSIDSAHFASYTLSNLLYLYFTQAGTYTVARADFDGFINLPAVQVSMGLVSADVDKILLGFYDAFPSKTNTGGTITLTGNQAPTGTYQAKVPPTTGKEAAYELLNDSGGVSAKHWATITVEGGGTP